MGLLVERDAVERIRLTREERKRLVDIAQRTGRTKSEVLRAGLAAEWERLALAARKAAAWERLKQLADEVPGEKVRYRMKD